ncbi:hypothetical protein AYX15_04896 [Cryptococcus neoformans]|nr:hypothetical protein AYX15_04896 [Cryptococcus neoformans var. grubii]
MRKGWKTAYNLTQEMELELETETSSQSIHRQAMRIFPMIVSLKRPLRTLLWEEPRSVDEGTSEDRQCQSRSIHGHNDNDDLQEDGNPCHEEDGGDLSSRHPLLEKSIRRRIGHPRRPHGQTASEMSEEGRKVFEEDMKLRREAAQGDRDREVREMARAEREEEHWAREAVYFEKQNDLSEAQKVYYERKTENDEAETAARIAYEMKISLQEALSVLRRSRAAGKDK